MKTTPSRMPPITFPHIGDLALALEGTFRNLGVEYIPPERPNARILAIGKQHSPEFVCFPFKIVLGELIVALEKGAKTLGMLGGNGPCRFGYYDVVMSDILKDLGYEFAMLSMDSPDTMLELIKAIRGFAGNPPWRRMIAEIYLFCRKLAELDRLQRFFNHNACLSPDIIEFASRIAAAKNRIAEAKTLTDLRRVVQEIGVKKGRIELAAAQDTKAQTQVSPYRAIQPQMSNTILYNATSRSNSFLCKPQASVSVSRPPITVGLVGEIYTVCDPEANFHIERRLAELGARVERAVWLSRWINDRLRFMPFVPNQHKVAKRKAKGFLEMHPGGECIVSVGESVSFGRRRLDGIIHLMPFTCMPEIIAQTILPGIRKKYEIPILTLVLDEHTDPAGLQTRIEAFCDFLQRKRASRESPAEKKTWHGSKAGYITP